MELLTGRRELDLDGPAVGRIAAPRDETRLLEPVEVTRQRRALDPDRAGEILLCPPAVAPERGEDQPRRHRSARVGERMVERAVDRLRSRNDLPSDRHAQWAHKSSLIVV